MEKYIIQMTLVVSRDDNRHELHALRGEKAISRSFRLMMEVMIKGHAPFYF
jgi:hypothetical protein